MGYTGDKFSIFTKKESNMTNLEAREIAWKWEGAESTDYSWKTVGGVPGSGYIATDYRPPTNRWGGYITTSRVVAVYRYRFFWSKNGK
jgi:hypothetical protein